MGKFRLEKVLNHRRALESLAQQEMALALQQESELRQALAAMRERLTASSAEYEARKRVGLAPDELLLYQGLHDRLLGQLSELQQRCEEAAREVECRRAVLVEASMAKQLLEKLKEKRAAEWDAELLHLENGILDEIAIQKFQER
ncbi:MAG: flagellar export protein FliJ [Desulfobulbaceae bacterium]|nr:flagellar export protein FliJ [Desulfobulbaceae bacterium]